MEVLLQKKAGNISQKINFSIKLNLKVDIEKYKWYIIHRSQEKELGSKKK